MDHNGVEETHSSDYVLDGILNGVEMEKPGHALSKAGRQVGGSSVGKSVT